MSRRHRPAEGGSHEEIKFFVFVAQPLQFV
jgi:hypothetical protein